MAYILVKDKPYYTNGSKVFACSLSADKVTVDFNNPVSFKEEIEFIVSIQRMKSNVD